MTDILNQIDAVLAAVAACQCGCGQAISERGPSAWFASEVHQERWHLQQAKGKSGIEEESAEPEVFPAPRGAPVATGDSSPEGRRQFVADVAAFLASMRAPVTEDLGLVPRPTFTLADMEEASVAVRARRAMHTWAHDETARLRLDIRDDVVTVTQIAVDAAADGSGAVFVQDSDGYVHLVESATVADSDTPQLAEDHLCVQKDGWQVNGEDTACHDGAIYGSCTSEYCSGQCEYMGQCECDCHEESTDG